MGTRSSSPLWRIRWAAIGAAVAVALGGGGLYLARAADDNTSVFVPVTPTRVLDTRTNLGLAGPFTTGVARLLDVTGSIPTPTGSPVVVPDGATAVVLNLTIVLPTAAGYASVRPGDAVGDPTTSNLNFGSGEIIPNSVTVSLPTSGGNSGKINLFYFGGTPGSTTHMLADIVGYYEPAGADLGGGNRISPEQIGMLRWDQDPGRAATIAVGDFPRGIAFDGTNIWVANIAGNSVTKIDPTTNTVLETITVAGNPNGIAFDGTSVWVTCLGSGSVSKINVTTNVVTGPFTVGSSPQGIAFDGTHMWVANSVSNNVHKINITTNAVSGPFSVGNFPESVAFDGANIWVTNTSSGTVSKINPTTNAVSSPIPVGTSPYGIAFDGNSILVTNSGDDAVVRINPTTNAVSSPILVGDAPTYIAFDGTSVWVSTAVGLYRINLVDTVSGPFTGGGNGIAFDGSNLWVSNAGNDTVSKLIPF